MSNIYTDDRFYEHLPIETRLRLMGNDLYHAAEAANIALIAVIYCKMHELCDSNSWAYSTLETIELQLLLRSIDLDERKRFIIRQFLDRGMKFVDASHRKLQ